ncbi:Serine/threonine protein kinase [Micromonospora echinofusca]|uniref:non-specific serine/threonine protein kinase n=1 Tax=Micromonospora echinofusca TaxID=47858 RepID=A0A1C5G4L7_MICEH|nr:serine/threonine-protein kinase [Micromonospora echinofusca]SCG14833.1 Serine/threonine protein kinase [Micromonospora echinofusca]
MTARAEPIAGRYELVDEIKSGGMGQVWRGYDVVLDREVAVKLIRADVIASAEQAEEFAKRFRREARVTARIQHHGVPQVYDAVLDSSYDRLYLVMEYVCGTSLRTYIDPLRPLPVGWATAVAAQICTVLSHAHAIPVVHRDLKPDNVLVSDAGAVKVLDFGIAAILRTDVTRLTVTGGVVGTHHYMSPEQIQGLRITPQSDLYALGCVLHELLVGRTVFDGGNDFELMRQHVSEPPLPLRKLRPDVPEALEELVLELTAKVPEQRPPDAYDVYERLLPFLPVVGSPPPAPQHLPTGVPDPTLLYRRPNAPRSRPESPFVPEPRNRHVPSQSPAHASRADLRAVLNKALSHSDDLLAEERYTQAAEALQQAIKPAAAALGVENPRVLALRQRRAAILIIGGDFRQALPEFEALYSAFRRTGGPTGDDALACLRQIAHCRAELGQGTVALRQFRQVLTHVRAAEGDVSSDALELRRNIGMLLLAEGNVGRAVAELMPLHEDLSLLYGPDHEEAREIADVLTRLRRAGGATS